MPARRRLRLLVAVALLGLLALGLSGCSRALIAPDGRTLYWANDNQNAPDRVDLPTQTVVAPLPSPTGRDLRAGLIAPDGTRGFVVDTLGHLASVNADGVLLGPPVDLGLPSLVLFNPLAAIAPDGSTAVFGSPTDGAIRRVDLTAAEPTLVVSTTLADATGGFAETAAFSPDGTRLFVVIAQTHLAKLRTSDLVETTARLELAGIGEAQGVVLSLDGTVGYAVGDAGILRFDAATLTATGTLAFAAGLQVQPGSLMRSPDGERLYLLDEGPLPTVSLHTIDLGAFRELPARTTALTTTSTWGVLSPDGRLVYLGDDSGYVERITVAEANALSVAVTGPGSVRASTAPVPCEGGCAYDILDYRTVTLTAAPAAGASFTGWGGACTGSATTCELPMSAARAVTAAFAAAPSNRIRGLRTRARAGSDGIVFTTRLRVPGPGRIRQTIAVRQTGRGGKAPRVACRATAQPAAAGSARLLCETGWRLRAALARGPLTFTVTTAFRPTGGTTAVTRRTLTLPRTPRGHASPVTG